MIRFRHSFFIGHETRPSTEVGIWIQLDLHGFIQSLVLNGSAALLGRCKSRRLSDTHTTEILDVLELSLDDLLAVDVDGVGAAAGLLAHQQGGD